LPHAPVKMLHGRSEALKARTAWATVDNAGCSEDDVSVGIDEVTKEEWAEAVDRPEIRGCWGTIHKEVGYDLP
jgi:phenylpyruvate tautomerase PptA (4-oxalocrotonate tautomerase family)